MNDVSRTVDRGFLEDVAREVRLVDLAALLVVPAILVAVFQLPLSTREQFVFDRGAPSLLTAYSAHFVHLSELHLIGNVLSYLFVGALTYLLCVLSERRQLFWTAIFVLVTVFPFALSGMQLVFPRERLIFGFSGINSGLFGLLCFSVVGFARANLSAAVEERFAPALLFATAGVIALVVLPARAWRVEIAALAFAFALGYAAVAAYASDISVSAVRAAADRAGYFELAGGALGTLFAYPFVGFGSVVLSGDSIVDVYVHLLGYTLAFIVIFSFVFVSEQL